MNERIKVELHENFQVNLDCANMVWSDPPNEATSSFKAKERTIENFTVKKMTAKTMLTNCHLSKQCSDFIMYFSFLKKAHSNNRSNMVTRLGIYPEITGQRIQSPHMLMHRYLRDTGSSIHAGYVESETY